MAIRLKWLAFVLFATISGCSSQIKTETRVVIDENLLQEGDLVFRCGRSASSYIVNAVDRHDSYSHVGILIKVDGKWRIIHAVPGESDESNGKETLKCDSIKQFFSYDRAKSGAIMRYDSIDKIRDIVIEKAKAIYRRQPLFDHEYLLSDSVAMYCTEFIYQVFLAAGIDLSEKRTHLFPLAKEPIIFPSDIIRNQTLKEIYKIKYVTINKK